MKDTYVSYFLFDIINWTTYHAVSVYFVHNLASPLHFFESIDTLVTCILQSIKYTSYLAL